MRKILVKILNLIYLAASVFAILSLCFEPFFKLQLEMSVKNETLVDIAKEQNKSNGSTSNEYNIVEIIEKVGDIETTEPITIEVPAKIYFDIHNNESIYNAIMDNLDNVTLELSKILGPKLKAAIKTIAMEKATTTLDTQINLQIQQYYAGEEGTAPLAKKEDVDQIIDNVVNLFENQEETTVAELMETIMGEKSSYFEADPQPTSLEELQNGEYYYLDDNGEYIRDFGNGASFVSRTGGFYQCTYGVGVYSVLKDLEGTPGFEKIDYNHLDTSGIESSMVSALETMPGLTDKNYTEVPMTYEKFEAKEHVYYIINSNGEYVEATSYDENETYYQEDVVINSLDDALAALLAAFVGDTSFRTAIKKEKVSETESEKESKLNKEVQDILLKIVRAEQIKKIAGKTVGRRAPFACAAIFVMFIFPWAWFAIKTFIRTLRKRKCWCNFSVVFIFGFIQLLLGAVTTLAVRFGFPKVVEIVTKNLPSSLKTVGSVLPSCSVKVEFGCLIASYVYLGMLVTCFIYLIFAHRTKIDFKYDKKHAKRMNRYPRREYAYEPSRREYEGSYQRRDYEDSYQRREYERPRPRREYEESYQKRNYEGSYERRDSKSSYHEYDEH